MLNQALIATVVIVATLALPLLVIWYMNRQLGEPEDKPPAAH